MSGMGLLLGMLGLATATLGSSAAPADGTIAARPVTYTDLGKLVRSYRGKVVVVDFWSVY